MDNYLYHHGILGQKWGVRRYQNEDGTLTPAGEKRYAKEARRVASVALMSRKVRKALKNGEDVVIGSKTGKIPPIVLSGNKNRKPSFQSIDSFSGNQTSNKIASPKQSKQLQSSPEQQKKLMTKGRAAVNGILRQVGMSAIAGVGMAAASKIGGGVLANYGTMTIEALYMGGTAANVGYTTARVVKSPSKKTI